MLADFVKLDKLFPCNTNSPFSFMASQEVSLIKIGKKAFFNFKIAIQLFLIKSIVTSPG